MESLVFLLLLLVLVRFLPPLLVISVEAACDDEAGAASGTPSILFVSSPETALRLLLPILPNLGISLPSLLTKGFHIRFRALLNQCFSCILSNFVVSISASNSSPVGYGLSICPGLNSQAFNMETTSVLICGRAGGRWVEDPSNRPKYMLLFSPAAALPSPTAVAADEEVVVEATATTTGRTNSPLHTPPPLLQ